MECVYDLNTGHSLIVCVFNMIAVLTKLNKQSLNWVYRVITGEDSRKHFSYPSLAMVQFQSNLFRWH